MAAEFGDLEVVDIPIEGTDETISYIPDHEEAIRLRNKVKDHLLELCGNDEDVFCNFFALSWFTMFDKQGWRPSVEEDDEYQLP